MPLVNPAIAMGIRPIEIQQRDPLQDYAQIAAIQNAQLQNQLARQQMEQEQGVLNYLREPGKLTTPEGRAGLRQFGKTGLAYEKLISEQETNALKRQELEGKLRDQRMTALGTGLTSVLADPSDANLAAAFDRLDATGVDTKLFRQQFAGMPDLASRKAAITQYVTSNPEGRQALAFVQPKPEKFDLNGKVVIVDMNPNSPTYLQEVKQFAKGMSPDAAARLPILQQQANIAQQQLGVSQGQLNVAQQRLKQEGQTVSIQQDANGNLIAVPTRLAPGATPVARPVTGEAGAPVKGKPSAFAEKAQAQRVQMGKDLDTAIFELKEATKEGGLIDQSTGSGVGRAVDVGARVFGKATEGDIAIGKLKPIADIVLKMVPRFEGPQSDKDTQSYKEAAGQLADPGMPRAIRKEAAKTIIRLMENRKGQFVTSGMAAEGTGPGAGVDTNNPLLK